MLKTISESENILKELQDHGPVTVLNSPEYLEAFQKVERIMKETHREFQVKNRQSQNSAEKVILTS